MLITRTVTKKILETIVHETFSTFGKVSSSFLLDSLKLLGFYYATNAGISINIEDLKTPDIKKDIIKKANKEINDISKQWQQGFVSDTERFQSIIDSWNIATESLKNRIVDYYQIFDPANNLYIMAFSGARGNMSQVRQLVGMRGLMSDQEGKIIDLPIQANFREGLKSIDYIISSYGARKGIVDTALKTADSGYLTRRLIYIAQDLIIRELDCKTSTGLIVLLNKKTNFKNLIGRTLINTRFLKYPYNQIANSENILTIEILNQLKTFSPLILNVRSSLTCQSGGSICQKCYGWDLAQEKIISLGEAVGIIAAQSIGEPGTQLTMRTFHTGGIFTSETVKQILAPFSGKVILPVSLKTISYRTTHGTTVLKLQQEALLTIVNWKGIHKTIFLDIGSFLYLTVSNFVKKGQLIAEYSTQATIPGSRRLKPVYTAMSGEIRFENLLVRKIIQENRTLKVNQDDGILWIASGKMFPIPKEFKYKFPKVLKKSKSFGFLKFITPYEGIVLLNNNSIVLITKKQKIILDFSIFKKKFRNCVIKISPVVKNFQYVDKGSILAFFDIYPEFEGLIYSVRKKESKYISTLFLITESDIWKINSDQINNFAFFQDKKIIVRSGNLLNTNSKLSRSGFFLKKDGFKLIFQTATPIFLSRGTILNYKQGDFVLEKTIFAMLVNYTQQTEDIVQGLPKIEELIEARRPKIKSYLSLRPGILLNSEIKFQETLFKNHIIECLYNEKSPKYAKQKENKKPKQFLSIGHSIFLKEEMIIYNNHLFKVLPIPSSFQPMEEERNEKSTGIVFRNISETQRNLKKSLGDNDFDKKKKKEGILLIDNKLSTSFWEGKSEIYSNNLFKYKNNRLLPWASIKNEGNSYSLFENEKKDLIVKTEEFDFILLEAIKPLIRYELPLSVKTLFNPGEFVDIGEPITEGIIDIHELLYIFFEYHLILDGILLATIRSLYKFQLLLVNSVQAIYQSQGVNISSKHIEIIVRQMTSKAVVKQSGDTPLLPGELVRISLLKEIYFSLKQIDGIRKYKTPKYEPLLLSATSSSLSKDGFLSAAGFQETKRVLTKAALEGTSDWLRGLKECIIIGRLIPAGSSFLNYKNYLDNIYLFKN